MTNKSIEVVYGIDRLRAAVRAFSSCSETFLQSWTASELLQIHRAWTRAEWDNCPDTWEEWQLNDAIAGYVPEWDSSGCNPIPHKGIRHD